MTTPPPTIEPTGFVQTFKDDFATLDLTKWRTIIKGDTTPPSAAARCNTASTYFGDATDGHGSTPFGTGTNGLSITATKRPQPFGCEWRSGQLNTKLSFTQLHGYFEATMDLPGGIKGAWPAFWLMPDVATGWPLHGEIDAPEMVGTADAYFTVHSGAGGAQPAQVQQSAKVACSSTGYTGYHQFGVRWDADAIGFYIDRKLVAQTQTPVDYTVPMYLILNLNMGGSWPGQPTVTSARMLVKEVSVWRLP